MNVLNEKGLEAILSPENLNAAYLKVKANKGAAGVDGVGVDQLAERIRRHWETVEMKIREGRYEPGLLRVVDIPKSGGGERELNIPTTQDRLIQQAIAQPLSEVFDPLFSDHSYAYRPGRSAHDAVRRMRHYVVDEGCGHIVDVDIQGFFDEVNHDILMQRVSDEVRDKRVLRLIGKCLRAGKLVNNRKVKHNGTGIPQGGPLSPILANIYLTRMDRELEQRGIRFVRYADDVTLYCKKREEAEDLLEWLSDWLWEKLKLRVNRKKSGIRPPHEGNFLGFRVEKGGEIALSRKSLENFKAEVRRLLDNRNPWRWKQLITNWQRYLRGWWGYFGISEWYDAERLSSWCRRHIRKLCWQRWHNRKGRLNALRRLGAKPHHVDIAKSSRGAWRIAASPAIHTVLNNQRLLNWGFVTPFDLAAKGNA